MAFPYRQWTGVARGTAAPVLPVAAQASSLLGVAAPLEIADDGGTTLLASLARVIRPAPGNPL
ncbi:hypothetical protein [Arthrobacter sp. AFG7.2]|uniref:hypothetical protein n=1 Tax=Arthrobacter sp. AFG7.2 TaxID=1688693 RepID=UPI001670A5A1|nr:hypothetical protein [Arthrobacter sp. AFG7.2]